MTVQPPQNSHTHQPLIEIVRAQGWGDLLMATAVLPGLRAKGYRIRVVTLPAFTSLFDQHPLVDEAIGVSMPRLGSWKREREAYKVIRSATQDKERPAKTLFLNHPANHTRLRQWLSPHGDGEDLWWIPRKHALKAFCEQARIPFTDRLQVCIPPEAWAWGEAYQDSVLIQMFSSDPRKDWPVARWQMLARQIQEDFGLPVYQVGSPKQQSVPGIPRLENPSMLHAMAAVAQCRLFIGSDSVFNHVCRAFNRTGLILWGHTHPHRFGYGQNVNLWRGQLVLPKVGGQWTRSVLAKMSDRPEWQSHQALGENTLAQVYWYTQQLLQVPVENTMFLRHALGQNCAKAGNRVLN